MRQLLTRLYSLKAPLAVLLMFSILLTLYVTKTVFTDVDKKYTIQWGNAEWIGSSDKSSVVYFRKNLSLSKKPMQTIIRLSATDEYHLYVNGRLLDERVFISSRPTGIYDVTNHLGKGDNVIAVRVQSRSLHNHPGLLASVLIKDSASQRKIITDQSWRVMKIEERQKYGQLSWSEARFSDTHWDYAVATGSDVRIANKTAIDPLVVESLLQGKWIWQDDLAARNTVMKKTISMDKSLGSIESAWLGVFTKSPYRIFCNGPSIADEQVSSKAMTVYNITPCIHGGENNIRISLSGDETKNSLLVGGAIVAGGRVIDISSDSSWLYQASGDAESAQWLPAYVIDSLYPTGYSDNNPKGRPALQFINDGQADSYSYRRIVRDLTVWLNSLLLLLLGFVVFKRAAGDSLGNNISREIKAYTTPYIFMCVLLAAILLSQFDPDLQSWMLFSWQVVIILLALITAWLIFIVIELHAEHAGSGISAGP